MSSTAGGNRRGLGRLFEEVPELYDRVRPTYPDELFADLVGFTGMSRRAVVLEVGCGTGQALARWPVGAENPSAQFGRQVDIRG